MPDAAGRSIVGILTIRDFAICHSFALPSPPAERVPSRPMVSFPHLGTKNSCPYQFRRFQKPEAVHWTWALGRLCGEAGPACGEVVTLFDLSVFQLLASGMSETGTLCGASRKTGGAWT